MNAMTRLLCFGGLLTAAMAAAANNFPTADRVLYVQECLKAHPGQNFEMVSKCSCALDKLALKVNFDDYVTMTTIVKAVTIGGERGGELRDNESIKPQIKRYRDLQTEVKKSCFLDTR
ncbi:MAG: hypothetical protein LH479_07675 [Polaromonas sp.]|nr:hypothetical protein [Polaromonas sp.]